MISNDFYFEGLARPLTPQSPATPGGSGVFSLNDGKTTAYTYESFFASDGRSKNPGASLYNVYKPKYKCAECGKNYATSSNLSRYVKQSPIFSQKCS